MSQNSNAAAEPIDPNGSFLELRMLQKIRDLVAALEKIAALKELNGLFGVEIAQEALAAFDGGMVDRRATRGEARRIANALLIQPWQSREHEWKLVPIDGGKFRCVCDACAAFWSASEDRDGKNLSGQSATTARSAPQASGLSALSGHSECARCMTSPCMCVNANA